MNQTNQHRYHWEMILLISSGIVMSFCLRVHISVAILAMQKEYHWTDSEKGVILSSFFWGYTLGQVPAVLIAQSVGPKDIFGLGILVPSILTLFIPLAASYSITLVLCLRFGMGLFNSVAFPCTYCFFSTWVPASAKTTMIPTVYCGSYVVKQFFPILGLCNSFET
jgi:MFS transporter, ACS family, solute carrier family 17 (sodium-dependent inorganic phosphate cotransporter), other